MRTHRKHPSGMWQQNLISTLLKVRKVLVTAGVYVTDSSEQVQDLKAYEAGRRNKI